MGDGVVRPRFAWTLPSQNVYSLGMLLHWGGIEALAMPPSVWLCAADVPDEQWEWIRRLPGADRFAVLDDGQLIPAESRVPRGHLPSGNWRPLAELVGIELPPHAELAQPRATQPVRLVRSAIEREPTWLQTSLAIWTAYAVTAPQIRLSKWTFVASESGRVIIRGLPLPPLPGIHFVDQGGIAVPAGWTWEPHLPTDVLRETFALAPNDSVAWTADNGCERIAEDDWVQATRSAVRHTASASSPPGSVSR